MPGDQGALPTLFGATAPGLKGGTFYGPDGFMGMNGYPTEVQSSPRSYDRATAGRLWEVSEELTGVRFELDSEEAAAHS